MGVSPNRVGVLGRGVIDVMGPWVEIPCMSLRYNFRALPSCAVELSKRISILVNSSSLFHLYCALLAPGYHVIIAISVFL